MVGHVVCTGKKKNVYKILVSKPEGKKPLVNLRHRWEDIIRMDLREIGLWTVHLVQDRGWWWDFVNTVMNLWVP